MLRTRKALVMLTDTDFNNRCCMMNVSPKEVLLRRQSTFSSYLPLWNKTLTVGDNVIMFPVHPHSTAQESGLWFLFGVIRIFPSSFHWGWLEGKDTNSQWQQQKTEVMHFQGYFSKIIWLGIHSTYKLRNYDLQTKQVGKEKIRNIESKYTFYSATARKH